jgi:hypothetical protein
MTRRNERTGAVSDTTQIELDELIPEGPEEDHEELPGEESS